LGYEPNELPGCSTPQCNLIISNQNRFTTLIISYVKPN
jgi:hypothetical protein